MAIPRMMSNPISRQIGGARALEPLIELKTDDVLIRLIVPAGLEGPSPLQSLGLFSRYIAENRWPEKTRISSEVSGQISWRFLLGSLAQRGRSRPAGDELVEGRRRPASHRSSSDSAAPEKPGMDCSSFPWSRASRGANRSHKVASSSSLRCRLTSSQRIRSKPKFLFLEADLLRQLRQQHQAHDPRIFARVDRNQLLMKADLVPRQSRP